MVVEEKSSVTVTELVVYPDKLFTVMNNIHKPLSDKLKDLFDYVRIFESVVIKRYMSSLTGQRARIIKSHKESCQNKFAIYSVVDSAEPDFKKVTNIMQIFKD